MIKFLNTILLLTIAFNSFADEKQACAGIAHSLGLHKEAKVYLDSATKEVEKYYKSKGLPDNEINLLVADIVYSPINEIKRMATMLKLSDENAANTQYFYRCSSIYKSIIANDGRSNTFAATQDRVEYENSEQYKQEQNEKALALALAKEKQEQQKALVQQEKIKRRAAQLIAKKKAKLIKSINNCKEALNLEATSSHCIGYQDLIKSGTYNDIAYEQLLSIVNTIEQKQRQLRKINKAKKSLINQIENCSKLFDIGFKPSSCLKYKLVIDEENYKDLSYAELAIKIDN